jgi:hypothetical protein
VSGAAAQLHIAKRAPGSNKHHVALINTLSLELRKAAERDKLFEFDSAGMPTDGPRPYGQLVRKHLGGSGALLAATPQFPEGQALGAFAAAHAVREAEAEEAFVSAAASIAWSEQMQQLYVQRHAVLVKNKPDSPAYIAGLAEIIAAAARLLRYQIQAEQCRRALASDPNDRQSINAVFAAPETMSIYTSGRQGRRARQVRFDHTK